jgi:hypothetical protein
VEEPARNWPIEVPLGGEEGPDMKDWVENEVLILGYV